MSNVLPTWENNLAGRLAIVGLMRLLLCSIVSRLSSLCRRLLSPAGASMLTRMRRLLWLECRNWEVFRL